MVNVFDENVVVNGVVFPCCIETNLSDEDFLGLVATKWGGWSKSQLHEWTYRSRSNGNFSDLVLRRDGIYVGKNNPSSSDGIVLVKSDGSGKWVVLGYDCYNKANSLLSVQRLIPLRKRSEQIFHNHFPHN